VDVVVVERVHARDLGNALGVVVEARVHAVVGDEDCELVLILLLVLLLNCHWPSFGLICQ
jgi:hypothetical protein